MRRLSISLHRAIPLCESRHRCRRSRLVFRRGTGTLDPDRQGLGRADRRARPPRCAPGRRAGHREPAAHLRLLLRPCAVDADGGPVRAGRDAGVCAVGCLQGSAQHSCVSRHDGSRGRRARLAQRAHPAAAHRDRCARWTDRALAQPRAGDDGTLRAGRRVERRHLREPLCEARRQVDVLQRAFLPDLPDRLRPGLGQAGASGRRDRRLPAAGSSAHRDLRDLSQGACAAIPLPAIR